MGLYVPPKKAVVTDEPRPRDAVADDVTHRLLEQVLTELRISNAYQAAIKGVAITIEDLED